MGQRLFQPPSVKGWDGGKKWIDAGSWLARHNYLAGLASAQLEEVEGVELALEDVFGEQASALDVLEHLLPGGARDEALRVAVAAGGAHADDRDALLAVSTALVLTSPRYQLV